MKILRSCGWKSEGKNYRKKWWWNSFSPLQACPFVIDIYAEKCKPRIKAIYLEAGSSQLNRAICKSVVNKGEAKVMDGCENIIIYTYKASRRITSVIENKVWHETSVRYFVLIIVCVSIIVVLPSLHRFWELRFLIFLILFLYLLHLKKTSAWSKALFDKWLRIQESLDQCSWKGQLIMRQAVLSII